MNTSYSGFKLLFFQVVCLILAILALWQLPSHLNRHMVNVVCIILFSGLAAASLNLLLGFGGLASLGQGAFAGIAAYAFAIFRVSQGWDYAFAVVFALIVVVVASGLFGFFSMRCSGITYMMMTLALANLVHMTALQWAELTGGYNGITRVMGPTIWGVSYSGTRMTFPIIAVVVPICFFLLKRITTSPFGMAIQGMRDNSIKMNSLGFDIRVIRILLTIIGGLFAGIAGILMTNFYAFISPHNVSVHVSVMYLFMGVLGGASSIFGGLLGAGMFLLARNYISGLTAMYYDAILGILFILCVFIMRKGVMGLPIFSGHFWKKMLPAKKA